MNRRDGSQRLARLFAFALKIGGRGGRVVKFTASEILRAESLKK
jgi:hypothetical protein